MSPRPPGSLSRPPLAGPDEVELVTRAQAGVLAARELLFKRQFPLVVNLAYRLMPGDDAEDIAQDVLVEALKHLPTLSHPGAFGGWVRAITVRTVGQRLRRRRIWHRLGFRPSPDDVDFDAVVGPAAPADVRLELKAVYGTLAALSVEERLALTLHRVEGLTLDEVAAAMSRSLATVKRRLAAAERALAASRETP